MSASPRKAVNSVEARRLRRESDRVRAARMREAYPRVGQLRIDLTFASEAGLAPSAQAHSFFPAARALFRFACPCAWCDGEFDLSSEVEALLKDGAAKRSGGTRLRCDGVRYRDRPNSHACDITATCRLTTPDLPAQ